MQTPQPTEPILSESGLLYIGAGLLLLFVVAAISFTVILRPDPSRIEAFRGGRALHYFTIILVVFATVLLGLERVLTGEAVASILGGIIGYVLGTLRSKQADNAL